MLPGIDIVLPHRLKMRTSFRRSLSEGLSVFEMWPRSKAAAEFRTLAKALYPDIVEK
jgi:cellulose biosynthesis protein BcsQ